MIQVYTTMNGMVGVKQEDFFFPSRLDQKRDQQQRIAKFKAKKLIRSNTFSQRIINDRNQLPEKVSNQNISTHLRTI